MKLFIFVTVKVQPSGHIFRYQKPSSTSYGFI